MPSPISTWAFVALEGSDGKGLQVDDYAGLGTRHPWLALSMVLFMLSLTGVPPSIGFVAKFYLFGAVMDAGLIGLALVGVLTSLISAASSAGGGGDVHAFRRSAAPPGAGCTPPSG
jgi:NADH-quinone oxidoreductase subunit N